MVLTDQRVNKPYYSWARVVQYQALTNIHQAHNHVLNKSYHLGVVRKEWYEGFL